MAAIYCFMLFTDKRGVCLGEAGRNKQVELSVGESWKRRPDSAGSMQLSHGLRKKQIKIVGASELSAPPGPKEVCLCRREEEKVVRREYCGFRMSLFCRENQH